MDLFSLILGIDTILGAFSRPFSTKQALEAFV